MNEILDKFARATLKTELARLPEEWQGRFKVMYGCFVEEGKKGMIEEIKLIPINDIVDKMPSEKLDWAMTQVQNSLNKLTKTSQTPV